MNYQFLYGIGDMLALESHWDSYFRASIDKLYIVPYQFGLIPLFKNCEATKHIDCTLIHYPDEAKHIDYLPSDYLSYVKRVEELDLNGVETWDLEQIFQSIRKGELRFYGSSFLKSPVADVSHISLPERFVVIQTQTTIYAPHHEIRDIKECEWYTIIKILEDKDVNGVVLNNHCADHPPVNPRIIDMVGQTSIAEGIEILKIAKGYIGIDSWMAVMAAQLFKANQLLVRGPNFDLKVNMDIYYRPHTQFDFVIDAFTEENVPKHPHFFL